MGCWTHTVTITAYGIRIGNHPGPHQSAGEKIEKDMACSKLSIEESLVLACCCLDPGPEALGSIAAALTSSFLDWDRVCSFARAHGVTGLLYTNLLKSNSAERIPEQVARNLKQAYHLTAYRNTILASEHDYIIKNFNAENVPVISLKGIDFLESLYGNAGLRPLSDIDLLVRKSHLQHAERIMAASGYTLKKEHAGHRAEHFHSVFRRTRKHATICVELHWDVDLPGSPFAISAEELCLRALPSPVGSARRYRLAHEDCVLFNCFHVVRDVKWSNLDNFPLKNFCDLAEYIKKHGDRIDWHVLTQRASAYKITRPVFLVLLLLQELFPIDLPVCPQDILRTTGFDSATAGYITNKYVLLRNAAQTPLPSLLIKLSDEKSIPGKIAILCLHLKAVLLRYHNDYYASLNRSFLYTSLRTSSLHIHKLVQATHRYLADRANVKVTEALLVQQKKETEKFADWLHGR